MKEVVLTIIFGFSIKFCTHSCTKFKSAKIFSEGFFLLAVLARVTVSIDHIYRIHIPKMIKMNKEWLNSMKWSFRKVFHIWIISDIFFPNFIKICHIVYVYLEYWMTFFSRTNMTLSSIFLKIDSAKLISKRTKNSNSIPITINTF